MAYRYFDLADKIRYSDHLLSVLPGLAQLDPVINTLQSEHRVLRDRLQTIITGRDDTRSSLTLSRADRKRLDAEAFETLRSLLYSLKGATGTGTFDIRRFFPNVVTKDIGKSVAERKASLERCLSAVALYPSMPEADRWRQTLTDLHSRYNPKVDEVSSRDDQKRSTAAELGRVRAEWKKHYLACKRIVEGLLIRAGLEHQYVSVFLDLQQPNGTGNAHQSSSDPASGSTGTDAASPADDAAATNTAGGDSAAQSPA